MFFYQKKDLFKNWNHIKWDQINVEYKDYQCMIDVTTKMKSDNQILIS